MLDCVPLVLQQSQSLRAVRCPPPLLCLAGEYVAVEMIESVLGKNELVEQIWVYGSSFESVLVAVVVPNKGPLMQWAKAQVRVCLVVVVMLRFTRCQNMLSKRTAGSGQ